MPVKATLLESAVFDEQGKFFWSLVKQADWDRKKVQNLMVKKYSKTHWNLLTENERRQMLGIMRRYAAANKKSKQFDKEKRMRQAIASTWRTCGHGMEELHSLMNEWGFGRSLRECTMKQMYVIYDNVKDICTPVKNNKKG